jgi:hypothetical protein
MSHRNVVLEDAYGDHHRGVEHLGKSDEPPTITVGSTRWYTTTWTREGWVRVWAGEWEE